MKKAKYLRLRRYLIDRLIDQVDWYVVIGVIILWIVPFFFEAFRKLLLDHLFSGSLLYLILVSTISIFVISLEHTLIISLAEKRLTEKYTLKTL